MDFKINDKVVLYNNYLNYYKIIDKGKFFSELKPGTFKILYKLSSCGEVWYSEENLQLFKEENVVEIQNQCPLCQKYGKPLILNNKYCMGFIDYAEKINCLPSLNRDCSNCNIFIENF